MAKLPWMPFYPADYLLDTQLLSPAARGIWMDLICHLWRAETRGTMTLSVVQWSRILRADQAEVTAAFKELATQSICNIVTSNSGDVTVESRRLLREEKDRQGAAKRMRELREKRKCSPPVTPYSQNQSQNQKLEEEKKETPSRALDALEKFEFDSMTEWLTAEGVDLQAARMAFQEFKDYWRSVGGKRTGGKVIKDWPATFRNRIRDLKRDGKVKLVVFARPRPALVPAEPVRTDPPTSEAKAIMSRLLPTMANVLDGS